MRAEELITSYKAGERDFSRADLQDADLSGADLTGVNLVGANLSRADLSRAKLIGANREYIYKTIPHIADLLSEELDEVLDHAEILIIGYDHPDYRILKDRLGQYEYVLDLAHVWDDYKGLGEEYSGICWG